MTLIHDDDVSIDELREAVEHLHGVPARFVEAVRSTPAMAAGVTSTVWSMGELVDAALDREEQP